jgi:hypothetical protein
MRRVAIAFGVACIVCICAIAFGLHEYAVQPQGVLLYTPKGPCPGLAHSFGISFEIAFLLAAVASACVALLLLFASSFWRSASIKGKLRHVAVTAGLVLPFLYALSLTRPLFESQLPLHPVPGCPRAAS